MEARTLNPAVEYLVVLLTALCALCGTSCDEETTYGNACPRLNHVGPAWWDGDLHIGVWVQDLEEDPVDLVVTIDGKQVEAVHGHGAVGLTSEAGFPGAAHEIILSVDVAKGAGSVVIEPVDLEGCTGEGVFVDIPSK